MLRNSFSGMDHGILTFIEVVGAFVVGGGGFCYALFRLEIARARAFRMLPKPGSMPGVDDARFARLELFVESIAADVERISAVQEFQGRLLAGRSGDGPSRNHEASLPERQHQT